MKSKQPGNIMQPRNKREEAIIENVLEHAEEIRAARVRTTNRAIAISPHYSEKERRAAQTKGDIKTLREYLTRARETAEKAISDEKRASFIDADAIPSISRDLKSAIARLDRTEAGAEPQEQHTPINMRPTSEDDARRIADELTNIGIDDHDRKSLITLICGIAVIDNPIRRQEVAEVAVYAIYKNLNGIFDEVARFVAGIYAEEDKQKGGTR
jgi:hypothetical protein